MSPRILVALVEDDPGTREVFGMVLEVDGFEVAAFASAEEALERLPALLPTALVTDLSLSGGMDGIELARAIRARPELAGIVLFAITGWDPQGLPAAERELFDRIFIKPADLEKVSEAIRSSVPQPS